MSKTFKLKIATPERVILEESVEQVSVPTTEGEITVLPNHIPLISSLKSGDIVAVKNGEPLPIAVVGGFLQVKPDEVVILADFAEHVGEMAEEEIEKAKLRAQELRERATSDSKEDFEHFEAELERALTRARIHGKWKDRKYRKLNI